MAKSGGLRRRFADCRSEVPMKNKSFAVFSFLLITVFSSAAVFSQNNSSFNRPRLSGVNVTEKEVENLYNLEQQVFALINDKRAEIGLPELRWSEDVARVARIHSQDMAETKYFSHSSVDGKRVDDRANQIGVRGWRFIGENIAYNRGFANPCGRAVDAWMRSTGHRENILGRAWTETGIGIAVAADGSYYFTQVFLMRK